MKSEFEALEREEATLVNGARSSMASTGRT